MEIQAHADKKYNLWFCCNLVVQICIYHCGNHLVADILDIFVTMVDQFLWIPKHMPNKTIYGFPCFHCISVLLKRKDIVLYKMVRRFRFAKMVRKMYQQQSLTYSYIDGCHSSTTVTVDFLMKFSVDMPQNLLYDIHVYRS